MHYRRVLRLKNASIFTTTNDSYPLLVRAVKHHLVIFVVILSSFHAVAQQPSFFFFGQEALEGLDIYSIVQDFDHNYWISTDQGLYKHDGYSFTKTECEGTNSISVFNLERSASGIIYCINLNHQIFRIKNGQCSLIYEVPDEGNDVSIAAIDNDRLVVNSSRNLYLISSDGTLLNRTHFQGQYINMVRDSNRPHPFFQVNSEVIEVKNNQFVKLPLTSKGELLSVVGGSILRWYELNSTIYATNLSTNESYSLSPSGTDLTPQETFSKELIAPGTRFYSVKDELWVANNRLGVHRVRSTQHLKFPPERIFHDLFISCVYADNEGNVLVGTFDHGIIVIPNLEINDVLPLLSSLQVTKLESGSDGSIYLGTQTGAILKFDQKLHTIRESGSKFIETIAVVNDSLLLSDNEGFEIIDLATGNSFKNWIGSLKDALFIDGALLCGFNVGLVELYWDGTTKRTRKLLTGRLYNVCREQNASSIYLSSADGVKFGNAEKGFRKILFRKKGIQAIYIDSFGDRTYIATREDGILIFSNGQFIKRFYLSYRNERLSALKFIRFQDKLVVNTEIGLVIAGFDGKIDVFIDKATGISTNKIVDYCISGSTLWVAHNRGVQRLDLNKLKSKRHTPKIFLRSILAGDKPVKAPSGFTFDSDQRKFTFEFFSPTLIHRDKIRYHYRLLGADTDWTVVPYSEHSVVYNSLAPGTYTFEVRAENNGVFSSTESYRFTISAPFYERWWFWLIASLVVIGTIVLIYQRRLRIQQAKSRRFNELNTSRLTAIRSQMNPHFIFNSLNSIQDLVLKGDVNNSYTSITKFSHLVRRTLNYSDKDLIDFEQEIELIELYLSLEQLRFKDALKYTIDTNDVEDVLIPPMLIQPFIENALIHGLLHKDGEKRLEIVFTLEDEQLKCTVRDNGIGRKRSREIQIRQGKEHQSFATEALKRRFELLEKNFNQPLGFAYEDSDEGTSVQILLPFTRKF